ncbi:hypothetical protein GGR52DRAFT_540791 [Hypoxylon sp. FL1284]|nr:hypothetical protein GGR52DRAFT_540791 [Hypoxylon sp. FL1284]
MGGLAILSFSSYSSSQVSVSPSTVRNLATPQPIQPKSLEVVDKMHRSLLLPVSLFSTLLSFYGPSSALPFISQRSETSKSLAARATYSIVPIDGGGQDSNPTETPGTVIETIVVTQTPTTKTVVEASPPVTDTVIVTADPATRTVSATVSVVDIQPTTDVVTTTVTESDDAPSSTLSYPSAEPTTTTATPSTTSAGLSSTTLATMPTTTAVSNTSSTSPVPLSTSSASASLSVISTTSLPVLSWSWSSSTSYDDGYWHTTYPPWNGTVTRRFAR